MTNSTACFGDIRTRSSHLNSWTQVLKSRTDIGKYFILYLGIFPLPTNTLYKPKFTTQSSYLTAQEVFQAQPSSYHFLQQKFRVLHALVISNEWFLSVTVWFDNSYLSSWLHCAGTVRQTRVWGPWWTLIQLWQ